MAIKTLPRVTCSLYVGPKAYIYNMSFNYTPQEGVRMSLFFVNKSGEYDTSDIINMSRPVSVTMDGQSFNMYAYAYELSKSSTSRTIRVDLTDDTFRLNNYYIVLRGQGCGKNVFQLGRPVDDRSLQEKLASAQDKVARQIRELTQFEDMEYSFGEFVSVLKSLFNVEVTASYDSSMTKGFTGSFREVLDSWCSYFNMSYFFENSTLKIASVEGLNIVFPSVPPDAIESSYSENIENTFTKTAFVYFRQEGGQMSVPLAGTDDNTDANSSIITYATLYPLGAEYNLPQQEVDLNQVAAAMYGQKYWFLYNYAKGTAQQECGWQPQYLDDIPENYTIRQTLAVLVASTSNGGVATFNTDIFNERYQFYRTYGERIAGRYYLSPQRSNIVNDQTYQWFDEPTTANFSISQLENPVSVSFYQQGLSSTDGSVPGTEINKFYNGVKANGNRLIYVDPREYDLPTAFALSKEDNNNIDRLYAALTQGSFGGPSLDFGEMGDSRPNYVVFENQVIDFSGTLPTSIPAITADQLSLFKPRFSSINLKGVKASALSAAYGTDGVEDEEVKIITTGGPRVVANVSTIKTSQGSDYVIYYDKYEKCDSRSSSSPYAFRHLLVPRQASIDIPVTFDASKSSRNVYKLNRDLTFVNRYMRTDILSRISRAQLEPLKTLTFSLNYLSPSISLANILSQGFTGLTIDLSENGMRATYTFSNSVALVPVAEAFIDKLERSMKSSWTRAYNPEQSIGN